MKRVLSKEEWRRKKRRRNLMTMMLAVILMLAILTFSVFFVTKLFHRDLDSHSSREDTISETISSEVEIQIRYLTPNPYSRSKTELKKINGVVIHYTANPGTTAENNRNYFEGLAETKKTSVSSHFIIGLEGEIVQCIPLTEIAYASNERNSDTIAIECCHPDETGQFNEETYKSLVSLTASLCLEYDLSKEDIIRHYDITEKPCPLYFVEHEDEWITFKEEVMEEVKQLKSKADKK